MTPAARAQTAIECLDAIAGGDPVEQVLIRWARGARFAGSRDRAAVRDLVFDILRQWWSSAARGGGTTGRARMLGYLRENGADPTTLFTGLGYGPATLGASEATDGATPDALAALDCPPEFAADLRASLGSDFAAVMQSLRHRAPVFLRVNIARTTRDDARAMLAADGVSTEQHPLSPTALRVTENPRAVTRTRAYTTGLVELQDAASQALTDALPLSGTKRILDYCAGGGGKSLAMAARHRATYHAHDVSSSRLDALIPRATRADVDISLRTKDQLASESSYDLVLVDAPCSGSGAWRRSPEGKIRMTRDRLDALVELQAGILVKAATHVMPGGNLVYATCSLLDAENSAQSDRFCDIYPAFRQVAQYRWTPLEDGDGFYAAILAKDAN